jgi:hypothetical protein
MKSNQEQSQPRSERTPEVRGVNRKWRAAKATVVGGLLVMSLVASVGATSVSAQESDLPQANFSGLTLPVVDPALQFIAPTSDQPDYSARVNTFVQALVPDSWNGEPVEFLSTYNSSGGAEVLGLPVSQPKADPNNPNFVYQRFQNGILFYNGTDGTTQAFGN